MLYQKKFYRPAGDEEEDKEKKLKSLIEQYNWCSRLPEKQKNFKDQVLFEYLHQGIKANIYDFDHFLLYLKSPKERLENLQADLLYDTRYNTTTYDSFWHGVHHFQTASWMSQKDLIDQYLLKYYQTKKSDSVKPFDEYFDKYYLMRLLIKARLSNGDSDIQGVSEFYTPEEIMELNNERQLRICPFNQKYFRKEEQVKIYVEMQNINALQVKVFDFNAENYYQSKQRPIDEHIDLDGLTANDEQSFDYSVEKNHPCKKVTREFEFPTITKKPQGIFIIEFFGNGIASRVVISKGKLSHVQRCTINGHVINIINEQGEVQQGTEQRIGVWIKDNFYSADSKGDILIPYLQEQADKNETMILVSGQASSLGQIQLSSARYSLQV